MQGRFYLETKRLDYSSGLTKANLKLFHISFLTHKKKDCRVGLQLLPPQMQLSFVNDWFSFYINYEMHS